MQRVFEAVLPGDAPVRAFDRDFLVWRIFARLPALFEREAFHELAAYVRGQMRPLKEFQLAQRIAQVFDRYLVYRPDLLIEWQKGAETHWQSQLWRELIGDHQRSHAPALALQLGHALQNERLDLARLPERVSIFGISSLPPLYIHLIAQIAT